jgi:hypothetical protein
MMLYRSIERIIKRASGTKRYSYRCWSRVSGARIRVREVDSPTIVAWLGLAGLQNVDVADRLNRSRREGGRLHL